MKFINLLLYCSRLPIKSRLLDTVYAVVYSLLLLNTDLHVAQGSYTRMTRHAFVKNTMSTIRDQLKASESKPRSPNYMMAWEAHIEAYLKVVK